MSVHLSDVGGCQNGNRPGLMGRGGGSTVDGVRPVGCQERQDVLEACL
ncbi:MAG: hypothetical protein VB934_18450 [Polyangiaceae bacterium]